MQPIVREIEQAAIGCWELVRGRDIGAQRFDLSIDGFWRSFRWAFILAVLDSLDALSRHFQVPANEEGPAPASIISLLLVSAGASLLTFVIFPVIVGALARPMGLTKRYPTYIIVRNWMMVFLSCPVYVMDALVALDILSDDLRSLLILILLVASLFANTAIAYILLGTSRSLAFSFALLDFLQALLIGEAASRLMS